VSNYLIRQGQAWSVKIPIPADVQHIFEKKAFKKTLKTSDKTVAIARSGPIIVQFKSEIENARGNPELLSNLVFKACQSCGDLVWVGGFNSVFERDAGDDFGEVVKAA
jgi:hypothetical protein